MRIQRKNADAVKLYDLTSVKLKTTGNTQVVQFTAGNNKSCPVRNVSKDTYSLKKILVSQNILHIDSSEHRSDYDDRPCEYYIGEPKNGKHRDFPMEDEIHDLLSRVRYMQERHGVTLEYVFANKDGRVNSHTISCAMTRRCKDAGIEPKCIHDIRRTVSSHLRKVLPVATVANMLGHLEETNEKYYNYDVTSYETKLSCLKGMYDTFQKVA